MLIDIRREHVDQNPMKKTNYTYFFYFIQRNNSQLTIYDNVKQKMEATLGFYHQIQ